MGIQTIVGIEIMKDTLKMWNTKNSMGFLGSLFSDAL